MSTAIEANKADVFRLKGSLFTLTVLHLLRNDEHSFKEQLASTIAQAPKFFQQAPIVIDMNDFQQENCFIELNPLIKILREFNLIPVGIRGADIAVQQQANTLGIAVLANSQPHPSSAQNKEIPLKKAAEPKELKESKTKIIQVTTPTKVITQPIRSGQQIYAKGSDLIALSSVSPGAEILADGHIHVYGTLRGRALAGVLGNTEARIFCKSLDAELVSIAGRYLVKEQLGDYIEKGSLHISLEDDQLMFAEI